MPLQGASDRFGEASPWCAECMVFVMLLLYITRIYFISCDADSRSQDDSGERRAIKTCRLATLDVNVRHAGANKPLAETCPWVFCRGSFPQKLIQAHGLHNFQDLQKLHVSVLADRSKALPALKRLALMDAAKAAQLAPEVVQMQLLQEEKEKQRRKK